MTADHTPERLRWHMHVSSGLICTMTHLAPDAEPTVSVHILTDDDLAAHLADVEARLAAVEALAERWLDSPEPLVRECGRRLDLALSGGSEQPAQGGDDT